MKSKSYHYALAIVMIAAFTPAAVSARNWYSGKLVSKVYDERPHAGRVVISVKPHHYECDSIVFALGENGLTDEHLNRIHATALAALLAGKPVGGLWDEPGQGCQGTNLHISE